MSSNMDGHKDQLRNIYQQGFGMAMRLETLRGGGGLEAHPCLTNSTLYQRVDNVTMKHTLLTIAASKYH